MGKYKEDKYLGHWHENLIDWDEVPALKFKSLNNFTLADGLKKRRTNPSDFFSIETGFNKLDKFIIGGFEKQRIYVIGALSHDGKTTFSMNLTQNILKQDKKVLYFTTETPREQFIKKFASMNTSIGFRKILEARDVNTMPSLDEIDQIGDFLRKKNNLTICDSNELCLNDLKNITTILRKRKKIDIVIIDFIQNINEREEFSHKNLPYLEFFKICKMLKNNIAKDLNMPVILTAQLNSGDNARVTDIGNKLPSLSGQKVADCKYIWRFCDVFLILQREKRMGNDFKLIIDKNRQGGMGEISLYLEGDLGGFREKKDGE